MNRHDHAVRSEYASRAPDLPGEPESAEIPHWNRPSSPNVRPPDVPAAIPMPMGYRPEVISTLHNADVVARYADQAPFLWLLRDRAVAAPNYSLRDLSKLDERVEANLDGLRVAGEFGWRMARKALDWDEPGEVFAAGVLALEAGNSDHLNHVVEVVNENLELQRGLISAAGWTRINSIVGLLQNWLASASAVLRRVSLAAHAVHRRDPGPQMISLLVDDDPGT